MHARRIGATQAGTEVVRIGHAVEDQEERFFQGGDQIRQIVFLILTTWFRAGNDPLVNRTLAFLIEELAAGQLDHHALGFEGVDQRQQTFVFTPFQNKDFLKTLRGALQQGLHRMDAVNHITH
ncbi:hypothetical protein D3C75_345540 [compost metagenome]